MVHMLLLHVPGYFEFLLIMGRVIRSAPPKLASSPLWSVMMKESLVWKQQWVDMSPLLSLPLTW